MKNRLHWVRSSQDPENIIEAEFLPGCKYQIRREGDRFRITEPIMATQQHHTTGWADLARARCEDNLTEQIHNIMARSLSMAKKGKLDLLFYQELVNLSHEKMLEVVDLFYEFPQHRWNIEAALYEKNNM